MLLTTQGEVESSSGKRIVFSQSPSYKTFTKYRITNLPKNNVKNVSPTRKSKLLKFTTMIADKSSPVTGYLEIFKKVFHEDDMNVIENSGMIFKVFQTKLKLIEWSRFVLIMIGWGLSVIEYYGEFEDYREGQVNYIEMKNTKDFYLLTILWMIFFVNLFLILFTILSYDKDLDVLKMRGILGKYETLFSAGRIKYMIMEIFILSVIPQPFLYKFKVIFFNLPAQRDCYYYCNDFLHLIMMLRIIIVVKMILNSTYWNTYRANRVCSMYGETADYLFSLKCLMKQMPLIFLSVSAVISILFFGHALSICEGPLGRPYFDNSGLYIDYPNDNMHSIPNCMWVVILTMTTVGYGDFYPRTNLGRIVAFMVCVWGVYIVSLTVIAFNTILTPTKLEYKAIAVLEKLKAKMTLDTAAKNLIGAILKLKFLWKYKKKRLDIVEGESKIRSKINQFKIARKNYKSIEDDGNLNEEIQRNFALLKYETNTVKSNQRLLFETQLEIMKHLKINDSKQNYFVNTYQQNQKQYLQTDQYLEMRQDSSIHPTSPKHSTSIKHSRTTSQIPKSFLNIPTVKIEEKGEDYDERELLESFSDNHQLNFKWESYSKRKLPSMNNE